MAFQHFLKAVSLFIELLDHENMGIDTILSMLALFVLKIFMVFHVQLMAETN